MLNEIGGSPFNIQHCAFNIPRFFEIAGGEWGLVAPAVFKTVVSARKRRKVGSIPTRLRHESVLGVRCSVLGSVDSEHRAPPDHLGVSVRNPTLAAPASCAASIAVTAL